MTNKTENLVLLKTCFDMTEAQILRGLLETNEILCFLLDEHHNNVAFHLNFALGGVRIMVLTDDLEKAQNLINEQIEDNISSA